MPRNLLSYIVRYDSGFAPNPFHGYCTLATCKPRIRRYANVADWLVGTGSNSRTVRRGGYIVYAMRVTEILSTQRYWADPRFQAKKPDLHYNWVAASGDNIYESIPPANWRQLSSYHSQANGSPNEAHVRRDTSVPRVLVSDDFVYFGGEGPRLPARFRVNGEFELICSYRNYRRLTEEAVIVAFEDWVRSLRVTGFQGKPWDWVRRRA